MNEQEFIEKWPRLYEESGYEAALQYLQEIHHQVATSGATRGDSRLHGVVLCELGSLSQFGGRITEAETYYRLAGEVTGREDMATYQTALMYYHQVGDFVKTLSLMDSIRPQPGPMTKFRIAELLNYLALKGMALAKLDKDSEVHSGAAACFYLPGFPSLADGQPGMGRNSAAPRHLAGQYRPRKPAAGIGCGFCHREITDR